MCHFYNTHSFQCHFDYTHTVSSVTFITCIIVHIVTYVTHITVCNVPFITQVTVCCVIVRRGADKSLVRPRRKQATATKLGIYSTYSPQSSIRFLACCSNFRKPLKKYSEGCPSNQVSTAAMTSTSDEKWQPFNFSPGNRW